MDNGRGKQRASQARWAGTSDVTAVETKEEKEEAAFSIQSQQKKHVIFRVKLFQRCRRQRVLSTLEFSSPKKVSFILNWPLKQGGRASWVCSRFALTEKK